LQHYFSITFQRTNVVFLLQHISILAKRIGPDTLQALIKRLSSTIRYPIDQGSGVVTLQYADDTLIVLRGETSGVSKLKEVLDMCSPMQLA